jgi:hypothetical protein
MKMDVPKPRRGIFGRIPVLRSMLHYMDLADAERITEEHLGEQEALATSKFRENTRTQLDNIHAYATANHQLILDLQRRLNRIEEALDFYKWTTWLSPIAGFILAAIALSQCHPHY